MSNYNGNNYQQRNHRSSSNLCPQGSQLPYMFGGNNAGGGFSSSRGQSYSSSNLQREANVHVRDCLYWPESLASGTGTSYGSNQYGGGHAHNASGVNMPFTMVTQPQIQQSQQYRGPSNYPQPKAFVQLQGQGQGEMKPMQIQCQMGPSGSNLPPLAPSQPLTVKVTAPPGSGANGAPIQFQISPDALWGGRY